MKTNRTGTSVLNLALALLLSACGTLQLEVESARDETAQLVDSITEPTATVEVQPTAVEEGTLADPAAERYSFNELGISLEVPADLYVIKDPIVKIDDTSKLDSYLFYIQNYGFPGGPSSGDFQIYGHLQYNLPLVSWEDFSNAQVNSPMNAYADYIEVGGLRGYDTQLSGERNRFVYHFYMDGRTLSIAVSQPTEENKARADAIINSLEILPGGLSDASHVKLVSEPSSLFQILIPEDWNYTINPTPSINHSEMEASSPDIEIVVEEGAGHSDIYYKKGVFMTLIVFEDDAPAEEPYKDLIRKQYSVYFNGIMGTEYVFVEPSTAQGELRGAQVFHDGKNYILRFGYADDTYRDAIDRVISSLQITPETFYYPQ